MGPYRTHSRARPSWWALMKARLSVFAQWWKGPTIPHWSPDVRDFEAELTRRKERLADIEARRR